jgi:nucleotide-binding universal stress UspA family protein
MMAQDGVGGRPQGRAIRGQVRFTRVTEQELAYRTIVCGVDGSPEGLVAARQASELGADGAAYWAVTAWDPGLAVHAGVGAFDLMNKLREEARSALSQAKEALPGAQTMLMRGRSVPAMLSAIAKVRADLVCVGSHGTSRPAGVLFGSVASAMAHYAPCSVLVARSSQGGAFPGAIVHANDGSPEALDAGRVAGRLAARHESTIVTLHVGESEDPSVAEEAASVIESSGRKPVVQVEQGSPHRRIVEVGNDIGASLIVMGSRGRTGLAALGSVSERVAHRAGCSVLIVRRADHPVTDDDELR